MNTIRIGNGAGFWGDNLDAPQRLAEQGGLDYLTLEYLAELTLSILAHQRSRDPNAGYVADFVSAVESLLDVLKSQESLKIVTNAGGMNPLGCARAVAKVLAENGLEDVVVAAVAGDDLSADLDAHAEREEFRELKTGASFADVKECIASANVYLGAEGIAAALEAGARIVIAGRVADASLTVGPAAWEFGWQWDDWDRLAAASVAGHLIECGAQSTGGMFSDWTDEIALTNVGYPIAVLGEDGSVAITKPEGSEGVVNVASVAEQLVYEIGDPRHYLTPDVDADFSQVELTLSGEDQVCVTGARGNPRPQRYKVSMAYRDGYAAAGTLVVCGRDAEAKARGCGRMIVDRAERAGCRFRRTHVECLGAGDSTAGIWPNSGETWEVVLRVAVHADGREDVDRFLREFAPLVTSGPPGVTGYTGPRSRSYPVMAYWPTTIDRSHVAATLDVHSAKDWLS